MFWFIVCNHVKVLLIYHKFEVGGGVETTVPHREGGFLYDPIKWRSQNAEKVTHIKGRLLYQAMILYKYDPFQNGNFS